MADLINFNGTILPNDQPVFKSASRAARFGDGLFETMRAWKGKVLFPHYHAERLFDGLRLLRFKLPGHFNWEFLNDEIHHTLSINNPGLHARVRLMVNRGEGGVTDEPVNSPQFLIECQPIEPYAFNSDGFVIDIFEEARKNHDLFSHSKTSNYLPSVMAMLFSREKGLDECVLLNSQDRICEGSISNFFWIKDDKIFTPPLSEGGIAGTMRRYLLECLPQNGFTIFEKTINVDEMMNADEIFLTNAVRGIRWVKQFRGATFTHEISFSIFEKLILPLLK